MNIRQKKEKKCVMNQYICLMNFSEFQLSIKYIALRFLGYIQIGTFEQYIFVSLLDWKIEHFIPRMVFYSYIL